MKHLSTLSRRALLQGSALAGTGLAIGVALPGCINPVRSTEPMTTTTDAPTVTVAQGTLSGVFHESTGVYSFKGIPYAQSIAGRNRFAPPQPVAPWTGVCQAVCFADSSPQQATGVTGPTPVSPAFRPSDCGER